MVIEEETVMKKIALVFTALCACLISCKKENPSFHDEASSHEVTMKTVSLTATVDEELTKTSYAEGTTFSWTAGDEISVYCSDGNFYTFTANSSGATTTFTGSIPDGENLGSRAFFPANANHDLAGYAYNIPESKDLTSHPSAEIPMIGDKSGDSYVFTHCCGATKMTITNIPDVFVSIQIAISHPSLKLSGSFSVFTDEGYWRWNPVAASSDSEKNFIRKVVVTNNTATVYIPYASGSDWWGTNTVSVIGYNSSEVPTTLISGKSMKSIGTVDRAHVKPLTPLALNKLGFIDWSDVNIPSFGSTATRIVEWRATSDLYYVYCWFKITTSKIQWDDTGLTYDKSYIYTGFDTDQNESTGGAANYGINAGYDALALVYPFTGTTNGTVEFKDGEDSRSWIKNPYNGSSVGKVATKGGSIDATYSYVEIAIPRDKIGSPSSGVSIDIQHGMDYHTSNKGTITLE